MMRLAMSRANGETLLSICGTLEFFLVFRLSSLNSQWLLSSSPIRYVHKMPKEEAQKLIEFEPQGSFVLRQSESQPGCFALLYMMGGVLRQQLVEETVNGIRLRLSSSNFFGR